MRPNVERAPDRPYIDSIAVADATNLLIPPGQPIHFENHSCDPNLWHVDPFTLATRRDISAGEELTIDYATRPPTLGSDWTAAAGHRAAAAGEDWRLGELRERCGEHWVPVVLHKIATSL